MKNKIKQELSQLGWFRTKGCWAVVDGQFGSTGKGLASGLLAELFHDQVDLVTSNAGPNSGHTSYLRRWVKGMPDEVEKIVLQQLPTFGVIARKLGSNPHIHLNAGAIIASDTIASEMDKHEIWDNISVHPNAAMVTNGHMQLEKETLVGAVGSTGKGTGAALASKVMRDPKATVRGWYDAQPEGPRQYSPFGIATVDKPMDTMRIFMEISQGFSLSLNASPFYPYTTSRDCTIAQGLSDAGIHPFDFDDCMMVVRTFPIRVAGNSGPHYPDQEEITWDQLGIEPEITTVTKKIRRVFTFSKTQFAHAVQANRPNVLLVNFMQYLDSWWPGIDHDDWVQRNIVEPYHATRGYSPELVLLGYGPNSEDVKIWDNPYRTF